MTVHNLLSSASWHCAELRSVLGMFSPSRSRLVSPSNRTARRQSWPAWAVYVILIDLALSALLECKLPLTLTGKKPFLVDLRSRAQQEQRKALAPWQQGRRTLAPMPHPELPVELKLHKSTLLKSRWG